MDRRTFLKLSGGVVSAEMIAPKKRAEAAECAYGAGFYGADVYGGSWTPTNVTLRHSSVQNSAAWSLVATSMMALISIRLLQNKRNPRNDR